MRRTSCDGFQTAKQLQRSKWNVASPVSFRLQGELTLTQINLINLKTPVRPVADDGRGTDSPSTEGSFESLVDSGSSSRAERGEAEDVNGPKESQNSVEDEPDPANAHMVYHSARLHPVEKQLAAEGERASTAGASSPLTAETAFARAFDPAVRVALLDGQPPAPDGSKEPASTGSELDMSETVATEQAESADKKPRETPGSEGDDSTLVESGDAESSEFSQGDAQSDSHQREPMPESRTFNDFRLRSSDMNKIGTAPQSADQASSGNSGTDIGGTSGGWSQTSTWTPLPSSSPQSNSVPVVQVPMPQLVSEIPELVFAEVSTLDDGQTTELRIQVEPANLGTLDIQVRMDSDRLHAHIFASEVTTSDLLARDRTQLVQTLQDMGLDVSNFDISHRHDSEFQDQAKEQSYSHQLPATAGFNDSQADPGRGQNSVSTGAIDIVA